MPCGWLLIYLWIKCNLKCININFNNLKIAIVLNEIHKWWTICSRSASDAFDRNSSAFELLSISVYNKKRTHLGMISFINTKKCAWSERWGNFIHIFRMIFGTIFLTAFEIHSKSSLNVPSHCISNQYLLFRCIHHISNVGWPISKRATIEREKRCAR